MLALSCFFFICGIAFGYCFRKYYTVKFVRACLFGFLSLGFLDCGIEVLFYNDPIPYGFCRLVILFLMLSLFYIIAKKIRPKYHDISTILYAVDLICGVCVVISFVMWIIEMVKI